MPDISPKPSPEDIDLHRKIAKVMWKVQKGKDLPEDAESQNKMWASEKYVMITQARKVLRQLERSGITISSPDKVS